MRFAGHVGGPTVAFVVVRHQRAHVRAAFVLRPGTDESHPGNGENVRFRPGQWRLHCSRKLLVDVYRANGAFDVDNGRDDDDDNN